MPLRSFRIICLLLVLSLWTAVSWCAQTGRSLVQVPKTATPAVGNRVALIIGNSAYRDAPLKNPVNDAKDVAAALKKSGFSVRLLTDATREQMDKAITAFGREIKPGGVSMLYYAGHGIQAGGVNYLIPVDSAIDSEDEIPSRGVDVNLVLRKMDSARSRVNIVILDACRNNPFARSFRSSVRGLAQMAAPKGSVIVYATDPGSIAADGSGRNGIFTKHLLSHIASPGIEIEQMLKRVRSGVEIETRGRQIPWTNTSLTGDFYFVPGSAAINAPAAPAVAAPPPQADIPLPATTQLRQIGEVELTEAMVQGRHQLSFKATGASTSGDAVARRIASQKSAMAKIRAAALSELTAPPYNFDAPKADGLIKNGEVVDLSYGDGGSSADVTYRITLP